MKVLVVGDAHANLHYMQAVIEIAKQHGCEHILQVGDFGFWPRLSGGLEYLNGVSNALKDAQIELYFCDGNHEDHEMLKHDAENLVKVAPNVWYGPRGYTLTLGGVRILFMGGAVSVDRARRIPGYDWFSQEVPSETQWARALEAQNINIVVAHDVPHGVKLELTYKTGPMLQAESQEVRDRMQNLCETIKPKLWLGGHYHQRRTQQIDATLVELLDCEFPVSKSILVLDLAEYR